MTARRSFLRASLVGAWTLVLAACARKVQPTAAGSTAPRFPTDQPSTAPATFGPAMPYGPAVPQDATTSAQRATQATQATTTAAPTQAAPPTSSPPAPPTQQSPPTQQRTSQQASQPAPPPSNAIAYLSDVPVGQSRLVQTASNDYILVTRTAASRVVGFSAVCTHQGCTVPQSFVCPCHGSAFNPQTGAVTAGPANLPLPSVGVAVQGAYIVRT
jgi:Rieske Fe-S protein